MNTATGFALYLIASFALVIFAIRTPEIQYYTGGIVIALFIIGLFFAFGNAMRQGRKLESKEKTTEQAERGEQTLQQKNESTAAAQ